MPSEFTMQQKIKVITKLTESGYDTEKKLQKLLFPIPLAPLLTHLPKRLFHFSISKTAIASGL